MVKEFTVEIPVPERESSDNKTILVGILNIPEDANRIVLFAHGTGSGRSSPRNRYIARVLNTFGIATLLTDLLTGDEEEIDLRTSHLRFNIKLLTSRLIAITDWLKQDINTRELVVGYLGSSTGAAAALTAAHRRKDTIKAIVCRGGRTDLAEPMSALQQIVSPTLLIVGEHDKPIIALNEKVLRKLHCVKELNIISDTAHNFDEPAKIEQVAQLAAKWFQKYLVTDSENTMLKKENSIRIRILELVRRIIESISDVYGFVRVISNIHLKFRDREGAADILADLLESKLKNALKMTDNISNSVLVLGIPRGGAIIGDVVARKLSAKFDMILGKKLLAPNDKENAIGAIMEDGTTYIDKKMINKLNISDDYLENEILVQREEINRRCMMYRAETSYDHGIIDKIVILVDDGAATGATLTAAARSIKRYNPKYLIIAAPVIPRQTLKSLIPEANHVEATMTPSTTFKSVGQFYQDFSPINDEKVVDIARKRDLI